MMGWLARLFRFEDAEESSRTESSGELVGQGGVLHRWQIVRGRQPKVFHIAPRKLEDAMKAADKLLEGRAVFVNLQHIDAASGQRILDILAGVTYALRGTCLQVGRRLFWFSPPSIPAEWDEETVKAAAALFTDLNDTTPESSNDHFAR
jgi:FtsZ-interacting cell division protein YlmF